MSTFRAVLSLLGPPLVCLKGPWSKMHMNLLCIHPAASAGTRANHCIAFVVVSELYLGDFIWTEVFSTDLASLPTQNVFIKTPIRPQSLINHNTFNSCTDAEPI